MKKFAAMLAMLAASGALGAMPAKAALIGDFRLDGSLANAVGGPLTLTSNGGTLGANGITFSNNEGPTISGFATPSAFTIETRFSFTEMASYNKVMDFLGRTSDSGLYVLNGALNFYPVATGGIAFAADTLATVVFSRDAAGNATGYVNGVAQISFNNAGYTALATTLHLFRDDLATGGGEASPGFVDYVRIYDTALTAQEVAALTPPGPGGAVPEPASWAMMIAGFGAIGAGLRRRRTLALAA